MTAPKQAADRADEIARGIREAHLLTVALAAKSGRPGDLREACDLAQSAIAAAIRSAGPQWRPIETAPRNHFAVLTWSLQQGRCFAFRDVTWTWWAHDAGRLANEPTHWMPLPLPPKASSDQEGT